MISNTEKKREYMRIKAKEWRDKNPEKVWAINHSEANKLRQARYRASHKHIDRKPYMKEWNKRFYDANREAQIARVSDYRKKNPEKIKESRRKWLSNNVNAQKGSNYRLALDLRRRIAIALKKDYKKTSTIILLGASISEVKLHLEKQFKPGMSWKNHSIKGWHIDHIIPLSSFNLTKLEEQKKAFHFTNLQPLFAKDNIKKSNRMIV